MAFYTNVHLNKLATICSDRIIRTQCQIGNNWYEGVITSKTVEGTLLTIRSTFDTANSVEGVVTSVRLIDKDNDVAAVETCNISKQVGQGLLIQVKTDLREI